MTAYKIIVKTVGKQPTYYVAIRNAITGNLVTHLKHESTPAERAEGADAWVVDAFNNEHNAAIAGSRWFVKNGSIEDTIFHPRFGILTRGQAQVTAAIYQMAVNERSHYEQQISQ